MTLPLIATATFGLESVVARELTALGYESRALRPGWLAFDADESAVARSNLWLRASDRVLLSIASFPAADFDALFDGTRAVEWERFLPRHARIPVRGRSVRSALASVPACQSIVKKAIVERLKEAYGLRSLPEDGSAFEVEIALLKDEAMLVLDTTGPGLHKRGYRLESGNAPLKETLAAGLVLLSHWNRDRPFLDPFCGTGTLAIEAALIGRNFAPGRERSFAAESWPSLASGIWKRAREEARDRERPPLAEPLEASDRDEAVLALARRSATKASVAGDVRFGRRDVAALSSARQYGCLITNPPYAGRSGEEEEVRALYRSMPGIFRTLPTWSFFILTARRDFETVAGQEADRRRKLYNGDVECTYFQFLGPRPSASEAVERPVFGGIDERARKQAEIFANRLRKRAHHLRKWPSKRGTDVYRLYDRDIKEVPIALDRYGDALLLLPSEARLESRTRAENEDWLDLMARTAAETLSVPVENVVIQGRPREPKVITVKEEGIPYEVRLDGRKRELDPALRVLRQRIRKEAQGKRVLLSGPGAASFRIAAERGGARSVTESKERAFDLAILETPDLEDSVSLLPALARGIGPGGVAYLVTRGLRQKLDVDALSGWSVEDVTAESLPEEFRSRRPGKFHRIWRLSRQRDTGFGSDG